MFFCRVNAVKAARSTLSSGSPMRSRAHELAEEATRERDQDRRRHLADLVTAYERAADMMAPRPAPSPPPRSISANFISGTQSD